MQHLFKVNRFDGDGSNSITFCILGLTYIPVPLLPEPVPHLMQVDFLNIWWYWCGHHCISVHCPNLQIRNGESLSHRESDHRGVSPWRISHLNHWLYNLIGLWTKRSVRVNYSRNKKSSHRKLPQLFFKLSPTELNP
ncbi:MAG: hypothetical protein V7L00_27510 [Nostoc sp.]|uniref:hypothetical protein n=1 Tax=Nostoc sp. TaxID=1180 RepID=UPI002FF8389F